MHDTQETLERFTQDWNTNSLVLPASHDSPAPQSYRLRPSSLGEPGYVLAVKRLLHQYGKSHEGVATECYGKRQDMFQVGHETEARIVNIMRTLGMQVEAQVPITIELAGFTIHGTADLVLNGDTVVDVKTTCASNYKRYQEWIPEYYQVQVRIYCKALGISQGALLLYNKDTHDITWVEVKDHNEVAQVELELARIAVMDTLPTLEDKLDYLFDNFYITPPKPQISKGSPTGQLLTPPDLYFNRIVRDILWVTNEQAGTTYITGAREFDDMVLLIKSTYSE